jgi:thiol-disulfide isomerase/thioredoxin
LSGITSPFDVGKTENDKMKRSALLLIFAAAFAVTACHKNQEYILSGRLEGVPEGVAKLVRYNDSDRTSTVIDSVPFRNRTFKLTGSLAVPEMMTLVIDPGNWSMPVFVENSRIRIDGDTTGASHYDYTRYQGSKGAKIKEYQVTGSVCHNDYLNYVNDPGNLKFQATFDSLNKLYEAEKDPEGKEALRPKFDSVRALSYDYQRKWIGRFITKNPTSVAGVYLLSDHYRFDSGMPLNELESMVNQFQGDPKSTRYYSDLTLSIAMRTALLPGHLAPDFTLRMRDSTPFTLSITRGAYVMIDFWASWCKPCRAAIPHWKEVYKEYHEKGFEIVSVSDDSKWEAWTHALDAEKMPWHQVIDEFPVKNMPARVGTLYQTHFIPFYVLLDKMGKILVYTDNEEEITNKLKELL